MAQDMSREHVMGAMGEADEGHSSLLAGIVAGGPVFVTPPALAFSYPWVSLWATGAGDIHIDVPREFERNPVSGLDEPTVVASDGSWRLLERSPQHEGRPAWHVQDRRTGLTAVVRWGGTSRFQRSPDWEDQEEPCYGIWLDSGPQPTIEGYPVK